MAGLCPRSSCISVWAELSLLGAALGAVAVKAKEALRMKSNAQLCPWEFRLWSVTNVRDKCRV